MSPGGTRPADVLPHSTPSLAWEAGSPGRPLGGRGARSRLGRAAGRPRVKNAGCCEESWHVGQRLPADTSHPRGRTAVTPMLVSNIWGSLQHCWMPPALPTEGADPTPPCLSLCARPSSAHTAGQDTARAKASVEVYNLDVPDFQGRASSFHFPEGSHIKILEYAPAHLPQLLGRV